ncbi:hypothetical protein ABPG72_014421 [Tetrahymena utriculariae]
MKNNHQIAQGNRNLAVAFKKSFLSNEMQQELEQLGVYYSISHLKIIWQGYNKGEGVLTEPQAGRPKKYIEEDEQIIMNVVEEKQDIFLRKIPKMLPLREQDFKERVKFPKDVFRMVKSLLRVSVQQTIVYFKQITTKRALPVLKKKLNQKYAFRVFECIPGPFQVLNLVNSSQSTLQLIFKPFKSFVTFENASQSSENVSPKSKAAQMIAKQENEYVINYISLTESNAANQNFAQNSTNEDEEEVTDDNSDLGEQRVTVEKTSYALKRKKNQSGITSQREERKKKIQQRKNASNKVKTNSCAKGCQCRDTNEQKFCPNRPDHNKKRILPYESLINRYYSYIFNIRNKNLKKPDFQLQYLPSTLEYPLNISEAVRCAYATRIVQDKAKSTQTQDHNNKRSLSNIALRGLIFTSALRLKIQSAQNSLSVSTHQDSYRVSSIRSQFTDSDSQFTKPTRRIQNSNTFLNSIISPLLCSSTSC